MKSAPFASSSATEAVCCCGLVAHGTARAPTAEVGALRQMCGPNGTAFPNSFLKHADEQTLVGLAAVVQAIRRYRIDSGSLGDWAVLGAPRFLGRACLAVALQRFALEGAWGVSPHLIPHRSLHSVSGTISQAFAIHGPNFGVGGGPDSASEVMLTAAALLSENEVPGAWIVITGWDPEPAIETPAFAIAGPRADNSAYVAAALALVPWPEHEVTARQTPRPVASLTLDGTESAEALEGADFDLGTLMDTLDDPARASIRWRLRCGGRLDFERRISGSENRQ